MRTSATPPIIAAVLLIVAIAACSPSDEGAGATSTAVTITTLATTTTEPPPSTTLEPTTTLAPTTTSAPTTTVAPTTTEPADLTVQLTDEGIHVGPDWYPFGSDDDDTVDALTAAIGAPSDDSGWLDSLTDGWERFGVCPSPAVRGVSWGEGGDVSLQVMFTTGDSDFWTGGVEHFFAFYYSDASEPEGLTTPEDIGVGSSLGQLKAAYDPTLIEIDDAFFDPSMGAWSYDYQSWTGLWGFATGQTDAHVITSVNGGRGCGE